MCGAKLWVLAIPIETRTTCCSSSSCKKTTCFSVLYLYVDHFRVVISVALLCFFLIKTISVQFRVGEDSGPGTRYARDGWISTQLPSPSLESQFIKRMTTYIRVSKSSSFRVVIVVIVVIIPTNVSLGHLQRLRGDFHPRTFTTSSSIISSCPLI